MLVRPDDAAVCDAKLNVDLGLRVLVVRRPFAAEVSPDHFARVGTGCEYPGPDGRPWLRPAAPNGLVGVADLPGKDAVAEENDLMVWASRASAEEVGRAALSRNNADLIDSWNGDLVAFPEDVAVRR